MKHDSLYIIMPAYNEEKNIGTVIEQWYPVVERIGGESRLVILNDGSRDGTYEMIRKYQKKYERLIGIDKPNEGHGGTILRGYHYAVDAGADYIFQTDSDGQTLPDEFWQFWKKRKTCGLLIVYRKKKRRWFFQAFCDKSAETGTVSDLWDMGKRCEYTVSSDECETVVESAEKDPGRIFSFQCSDDGNL